MRKWHTLDQAAERLTATKGDKYTRIDVLQLISDGALQPSWLLRNVQVQEVFPASTLHGGFTGFGPGALSGAEEYLTGARRALSGYARMPLERNMQIREWALAAIIGDEPRMLSLDGVILETDDGLFQAVMDFGPKYSIIPLADPVPINEIIIQERDIQAYLSAGATPDQEQESTAQRRARWLKELEQEEGIGRRGALTRVHKRELERNPKADRSYIGKQIKEALGERAAMPVKPAAPHNPTPNNPFGQVTATRYESAKPVN